MDFSIFIFYLAIFIYLFQRLFFKWTFKLSVYCNLLLFNRDGLFNYLAIFINVHAVIASILFF